MSIDLKNEPVGYDKTGKAVFLKDIWPSNHEIQAAMNSALTPQMFSQRYGNVFQGNAHWQNIGVRKSKTYTWSAGSTYVQKPPYFEGMKAEPEAMEDIKNARILALLGDSVTTDHISPAGSIKKDSPAGVYLNEHQVSTADFNSYGARRGNHDVMMRGTFANIRLKNEMVPETSGGITRFIPENKVMPIYDAAMLYAKSKTPLVVFAGKEYGTGSSRDWAAKGTRLLGVKAVIAESFERIHRSNLVGMGVLPLQFKDGMTRHSLGLKGDETISISGFAASPVPRGDVTCIITDAQGVAKTIKLLCRVDTVDEVEYYRHGGILHYVLRQLVKAA
jgi:aconitate hydratase